MKIRLDSIKWRYSLLKRYFHLYIHLKNWKHRIQFERQNKTGTDNLNLRNGLNFMTEGSVKITNDVFLEIFQMKAYLKFIKTTPKTVLDIGGHFGFFSIQMANKFPACKIYTFEPAPRTFKILENNVKNNEINNIEIFNYAVGAEENEISFYENEDLECSSIYETKNGGEKVIVSAITLNNIIDNNSIKTIDILKLDCEGAEFEIIYNNLNILSEKVNCIICEYHTGIRKDKDVRLDLVLPLKYANFDVETFKINESLGFLYAQNKNFKG